MHNAEDTKRNNSNGIILRQVLTFDSWIDHICRDMVASYDSYAMKAAVAIFLISWGVLSGFIMLNIVMAVLVESFTAAQREMQQELLETRQRQRLFTPVSNPMRRLVAKWRRTKTEQARKVDRARQGWVFVCCK